MTATLDHPLVAAARRLADDILAPAAEAGSRRAVRQVLPGVVHRNHVLGRRRHPARCLLQMHDAPSLDSMDAARFDE